MRGTLRLRCPRAFESGATQRERTAPLEDSTGASHVAEAGLRVAMMKIESDPNFLKQRNQQFP